MDASAGDSQLGTLGDEDSEVTAYASEGDTRQAILTVLHQRREYLQSTHISDKRHVLTSAERAEMVKLVRGKCESSEDQLRLQPRDREIQRGKGKGRGEAHAGGAAQPTKLWERRQVRQGWGSEDAGASICNTSAASK